MLLTDQALGVAGGDGDVGGPALWFGVLGSDGGDAAGLGVGADVLSAPALDGARVPLRILAPVPGGGGPAAPARTPRPALRQRLPAALLRDGLDVVVGTAGAGRPAAPPAIGGVQGGAVVLVLGQLVCAGGGEHHGAGVERAAIRHRRVRPGGAGEHGFYSQHSPVPGEHGFNSQHSPLQTHYIHNYKPAGSSFYTQHPP